MEIKEYILDYINPEYRNEKEILSLFSIYRKKEKICCKMLGEENCYDTIEELAEWINGFLKQASAIERFSYKAEDMIFDLENSDYSALFDEGLDAAVEILQIKYECDYETAREVALYFMSEI